MQTLKHSIGQQNSYFVIRAVLEDIPANKAIHKQNLKDFLTLEPAHEILVLITKATSEGSGELAHPRSLARAFTDRTHEVWK